MRWSAKPTNDTRFRDRDDAGRRLAERVLADGAQVDLVLGLPRGGVPVATPVARALGAPLDVLVVRKLGTPGHAELAMGAIGPGGVRVLVEDVVRGSAVAPAALERIEAAERRELERREDVYRGGRPPLQLAGRRVLIVDDGLATGATARAAVAVARAAGAVWVGLAVPIGPPDTSGELGAEVDRLWVLHAPAGFSAVGQGYERFGQVGDDDVRAALAGA
ncbi:MAG: phosphoribosyltransferase [Trueperaceae bacterium]